MNKKTTTKEGFTTNKKRHTFFLQKVDQKETSKEEKNRGKRRKI